MGVKIPKTNTQSKIKALQEQIKHKDEIIDQLRQENIVLLRTAFKKAYEEFDINNLMEKVKDLDKGINKRSTDILDKEDKNDRTQKIKERQLHIAQR